MQASGTGRFYAASSGNSWRSFGAIVAQHGDQACRVADILNNRQRNKPALGASSRSTAPQRSPVLLERGKQRCLADFLRCDDRRDLDPPPLAATIGWAAAVIGVA